MPRFVICRLVLFEDIKKKFAWNSTQQCRQQLVNGLWYLRFCLCSFETPLSVFHFLSTWLHSDMNRSYSVQSDKGGSMFRYDPINNLTWKRVQLESREFLSDDAKTQNIGSFEFEKKWPTTQKEQCKSYKRVSQRSVEFNRQLHQAFLLTKQEPARKLISYSWSKLYSWFFSRLEP